MIFAAGLGTRLKPLTETMPKALVPVAGKPLLGILIEKLKREGFTDIVINVHHFAEMIVRYVKEHDSFGLNISFSDESSELLETGGGIKKAANLLASDNTEADEPFLVHNVDILSNVEIKSFCNEGKNYAALLLVSERETQRYLLFDDNNRLVGWTNIKTGEVKSPYSHLDVSKCKKYAFAGIHLFSPRLFHYFPEWGDKFSIIDFYLSVCDKEPIYACCYPNLKLIDVGKLDTLEKAEFFLNY